MSDLSMEYHPVCKSLADWWDQWRGSGEKPPPPDFRWEEMNDGGSMESGRCPKCGAQFFVPLAGGSAEDEEEPGGDPNGGDANLDDFFKSLG